MTNINGGLGVGLSPYAMDNDPAANSMRVELSNGGIHSNISDWSISAVLIDVITHPAFYTILLGLYLILISVSRKDDQPQQRHGVPGSPVRKVPSSAGNLSNGIAGSPSKPRVPNSPSSNKTTSNSPAALVSNPKKRSPIYPITGLYAAPDTPLVSEEYFTRLGTAAPNTARASSSPPRGATAPNTVEATSSPLSLYVFDRASRKSPVCKELFPSIDDRKEGQPCGPYPPEGLSSNWDEQPGSPVYA